MAGERDVPGFPAPRAFKTDSERLTYDGRTYDAIRENYKGLDALTTRVAALEDDDVLTTRMAAIEDDDVFTLGYLVANYTAGDMLYAATDSTELSRLGIGTAGQILTVAGGLPSWATPAAGSSNWTDAGAYLHPLAGATEDVSIGATSAPTGSAKLGVTGAVVAHTHASGAATGDGRMSWISEATLTAIPALYDQGRDPWVIGTETNNSIYIRLNATYAWAFQSTTGTDYDFLPLTHGNQWVGQADAALRGVYIHVGTAGNNYGLMFQSAAGGKNAYITHDNSNFGIINDIGSSTLQASGTSTQRIILRFGATATVAYCYRSGTTYRFLPGTDAAVDLGQSSGAADNERWRHLFLTGNVSWPINGGAILSAQVTAPTSSLTGTTLNDGGGSGGAMTLTAGSTDLCGSFTVTGGNGTPGAGLAGRVLFNATRTTAPKAILLTSMDNDGTNNHVYVNNLTTAGFDVLFNTALSTSEVVDFYYLVVG